jgi:hypothetical protein
MTKTLALTEIADALDTLVDIMISDRMDELAGYNASFWRDSEKDFCKCHAYREEIIWSPILEFLAQ